MIEFIRQYQVMLDTGVWTHFMYYAIYAWAVMTPRSLGAGIVYSFQPYRFRVTRGYVLAVPVTLTLATYAMYVLQRGSIQTDLSTALAVFAGVVFLLTLVPAWGRAVIRFAFSWTPYARHIGLLDQQGVKIQSQHGFEVQFQPEMQLVFITIFNPDLDDLERNLSDIRKNFKKTKVPFKILAVIDGKGAFENSDKAIPIARKHCDVVASGNAQRKRVNLDWMIKYVWKKGWVNQENAHNVVMHFLDDDTIPHDDTVAGRLNLHFANPAIGGVTTAQYVNNPEGFWQHVMQIFESARNYGSQAFLTLFGAVGCLPGRWYAVRGSYITPEFATELHTEMIGLPFGFTLFGLFPPRLRDPGDDRLITIQVQRNGGLTILAPDAIVYTDTPKRFKPLWGMVTRWARSSNIYTIQHTGWMLLTPRTWPTLFLYWTNIGLAFGTVYIAGPYLITQMLFGDRDVIFVEAMLFMFMSMAMTMMIRQVAVWVVTILYLLFMPLMGPLGVMMQAAQVWGMLTYMKSKWTGVRDMTKRASGNEIQLDQDTNSG